MSHINDIKHAWYGLSAQAALAADRSYVLDLFTNIAGGASYFVGFTVDSSPVQIFGFQLASLSPTTIARLYEGGTYSGGTPLTLFNLNRSLNVPPSVFSDLSGGVTIDTPGTLIRERRIFTPTQGQRLATGGTAAGMIVKESTVYYIEILNDDTQASDYDMEMLVSDSGDI